MASGHYIAIALFVSAVCFAPPASASGADKVKMSLYFETLCPYCSRFMVNHLSKMFRDDLISVVDLNLVPYGNARVGANGSISCQHGPWECLLNTVEACAISVWPDVQQHFSFIYCIERLVVEKKYTEWESCFQSTGLNKQAVSECYNNGYGQKLELQYATETDSLQPRRRYVPWVLVDGQPLYDDYENFETYICKAYTGELPKACSGLSLAVTREAKANHADRVFVHPIMNIFIPTKTYISSRYWQAMLWCISSIIIMCNM